MTYTQAIPKIFAAAAPEIMNQVFNRRDQTDKRQKLRNESPPAERLLWSKLRGETCGVKFRRQFSVGIYVLDFYCPEIHLAIEVDGPAHQEDGAAAYDANRQQNIEKLGIHFLRFTNQQVYQHSCEVMETILATVALLKQEHESGHWQNPWQGENPLCPSDISPSTRWRQGRATFESEP